MSRAREPDPAASSAVDEDGVRLLRKAPGPRFGIEARLSAAIATVVAIAVGGALMVPTDGTREAVATTASPTHLGRTDGKTTTGATRPAVVAFDARLDTSSVIGTATPPAPTGDPDDLASYFRPGDPVPSTANLIRALNDAGVHTGIAAFNPPGTRPPLEGLAVPADFELPPGYVRHHQATDEGEAIEPILMFSPDLVLRDARGRIIPLPADLVVPPELAPPGLPVRWVRLGKP